MTVIKILSFLLIAGITISTVAAASFYHTEDRKHGTEPKSHPGDAGGDADPQSRRGARAVPLEYTTKPTTDGFTTPTETTPKTTTETTTETTGDGSTQPTTTNSPKGNASTSVINVALLIAAIATSYQFA